MVTSTNQRLQSADNNDQRSKRCALRNFPMTDGQTRVVRWYMIEGPNARDSNCAFHSFLVEVQTNAGYIHATHE